MELPTSPLFILWLIAVVAFTCACRAGWRRNQNHQRDF